MRICYYGIDFHVNRFTYHVIITEDGKCNKHMTETLNLSQLSIFLRKLTKNDYVCIEALPGAFAFIKIIRKYVKDVDVVNPQLFKAIFTASKKNDKIDAKKLANAYRYHIETNDPDDGFPIVYIPKDHVCELRSLFTTYNIFKKQVNGLKNRIHSILKENLIQYSADNLFTKLDELIINKYCMSDVYKAQLKALHQQLIYTMKSKEDIKMAIRKMGYQYFEDEIKVLISIKGITDFLACAIMADTADISRFKTSNRFTSYMRSAPRLDASNDKVHNGKTDKRGRKLSYSLILQGLQHIINSSPYYVDFYKKKTKGKSKGKVRSALVRKTFKMIFFMLRNKDTYRYCDGNLYLKKIKELEKYKKLFKAA